MKRALRYASVALAALALAYGARTWQAAGRETAIRYEAPAGEIRVVLTASDGAVLRRTVFASGERQHTVKLPEGAYQVRMEVGDALRLRDLVVDGTGVAEVRW